MQTEYVHRIDFGGGAIGEFTARGDRRFVVERVCGAASIVVVNADIQLADGSIVNGLLEIDESSSGEHCGTAIFQPDGSLVWQDDPDFLARLDRGRDEVFPYRYRYRCNLCCYDHHVGLDGWSR